MPDVLEGLNSAQLAAVTHPGGPLLIVAGAGTGKTTVITRRIAWLIEQGLARPEEILALTFTEKAAAEMEERVDLLLPMGYNALQISTFHAFCEHVLRQYATEIGLPREFEVLDEVESWLLARRNFSRFELEHYRPLGNPTRYLKDLLRHFSRAKDELIGPDQYLAFVQDQAAGSDAQTSSQEQGSDASRFLELAHAYRTYQHVLLDYDALDFGDLGLYVHRLIQTRPAILAKLRAQYRFILIDEFQDTNAAQYRLLKQLATPENNLTVVGDDDQSIYRFRGATIANILQFEQDFPDCARVVLTENYRSAQEILDHAYRFIQANNPHRLEGRVVPGKGKLEKRLASTRAITGEVRHLHFATQQEEANGVARHILSLKQEHSELGWNDIGVLIRANGSADAFVDAFERAGIPYQFLALQGLYKKPIILDLLAWMRAVDQPRHSPSLYRVLTDPTRGISASTILALNFEAQRLGVSVFEVCQRVRLIKDVLAEDAARVEELLALLERWRTDAPRLRASVLLLRIARESGLLTAATALPDAQAQDATRSLQSFYERVVSFETASDHTHLHAFLEELDHERCAGEEGDLPFDAELGPDVVRILTIHGSKGLEFRYVFVVQLVDRRFPSAARQDGIPLPEGLVAHVIDPSLEHLQEERRLMYVAMTRAKDGLFITSAEDYGGTRKKKRSRFLEELDLTAHVVPAVSTMEVTPTSWDTRPMEADPNVLSHLPSAVSFSQLRAFESCPLQYKFAHVLRIPVFGKAAFSYGKTMHLTLQRFFEQWMEQTGKTQSSLFDSGKTETARVPVSQDDLLELFGQCWMDDWYENDAQREQYRDQGRRCLRDFYATVTADPPEPLFLEQSFTMKVGPVVLKGQMDRIDRVGDGVRIVDYKTGTPKTEKTLEADDRKQLLLYQLAAESVLGLTPVELVFHYLEDQSQIRFLGTAQELADLQQDILDQVAVMRAGSFPPKPDPRTCRSCDFADICPFRRL